MRALAIACLALGAIACQTVSSDEQTAPANSAYGLLVAQDACGRCHAAGRTGSSANPDAPPFATIANKEGLTAETLSSWLRDVHNYPTEMGFHLEKRQLDAIVAYVMTLRYPRAEAQSGRPN